MPTLVIESIFIKFSFPRTRVEWWSCGVVLLLCPASLPGSVPGLYSLPTNPPLSFPVRNTVHSAPGMRHPSAASHWRTDARTVSVSNTRRKFYREKPCVPSLCKSLGHTGTIVTVDRALFARWLIRLRALWLQHKVRTLKFDRIS